MYVPLPINSYYYSTSLKVRPNERKYLLTGTSTRLTIPNHKKIKKDLILIKGTKVLCVTLTISQTP